MPTAMSSPLGFLVSRGRAALLAPRQRAVMNRASAPVRMWEILDPWVVDIKIVIPSEVEGPALSLTIFDYLSS